VENIINAELNGFTCKRCGICCRKEGILATVCDQEDWEYIVDFIIESNGGLLLIKVHGENKLREIFISSIEDIYESKDVYCGHPTNDQADPEIWDSLDSMACCPFLQYKITNHKREYYCSIEHIKPIACAAYKCGEEVNLEDFEKRKNIIREKRSELSKKTSKHEDE